jgi:hypothetical protein
MRHRASRRYAVVAPLLLAFAALCTAAGVAPPSSVASDPSAVSESRALEGARGRHEALAPRATTASSKSGVHVDVLGVLTALAIGAVLLLGRYVAGTRRTPLPRFRIASLGARAPPALV